MSTDLLNAPREFLKLFVAGKEAAQKGDNRKAHDLFRKAIEVDPYHEQVWLWLASVVETDEDRQVCFENVLELNPANHTAYRQLQRLEHKALTETMVPFTTTEKRPTLLRRWTLVFLLFIAALGTVAVAFALVLAAL